MREELIEEFQTYINKVDKEIEQVEKSLKEKLSDEPGELVNQVNDIEAQSSRIGFILADANGFLDRAEWAFLELPDIQSGKTATDRKIALRAKVVSFRIYRDHVEVLVNAIKGRIILGLGTLRYMNSTPNAVYKTDPANGNLSKILGG